MRRNRVTEATNTGILIPAFANGWRRTKERLCFLYI